LEKKKELILLDNLEIAVSPKFFFSSLFSFSLTTEENTKRVHPPFLFSFFFPFPPFRRNLQTFRGQSGGKGSSRGFLVLFFFSVSVFPFFSFVAQRR